MEKDIGKINKNETTDIVVRVDDFGGKRGLTIREFVTSDRYTGFTKAGVRIPAEEFSKFKEMINSISEDEMKQEVQEEPKEESAPSEEPAKEKAQESLPDY
ncbi:hypothetical protein DRN73_05320 [Candidatus Pacearchaeota archaeon]|nr:MAG: hypothetical protein DRN73_05320 [Candidatus Pacearchaeota archaeon]